MSRETITVNGTVYDKHAGTPLHNVDAAVSSRHRRQPREQRHSHAIHHRTQRSNTLDRRYVKRTDTSSRNASAHPIIKHRSAPQPQTKKTPVHPSVKKFAAHPSDITKKPTGKGRVMDIQPTVHPMVQHAHASHSASTKKTAQAPKPSHIIKREAESAALSTAPSHHARQKRQKQHKAEPRRRASRVMSTIAAGGALLLLSGYFTYINMPNLSVRVAAAQAGIDASYPTYRPNGYSLNGPIAYNNGQVQMKFAMNGGSQSFTLNQERSGWDSSAVLENYIQPKTNDSYTTTQANGLTIYSFNQNAAWVSGGILYTIEGDAPLSTDQIQRIAISM